MDLELDTLHLMSRYAVDSPTKPKAGATKLSTSDGKRIRSVTRELTKNRESYPTYVSDAFNNYARAVMRYYTAQEPANVVQDKETGPKTASTKDIETMTVALLAAPPDPATAVKKGLNVKVHRLKADGGSVRVEK